VRYGSDWRKIVTPPPTILSDVAAGRLSGVTWVAPDWNYSDARAISLIDAFDFTQKPRVFGAIPAPVFQISASVFILRGKSTDRAR
jgi:hypothetical protein